MTSLRDVVVTGLGATTPLGGDVASTWAAALAGQSGARPLENDWAERYEIPVTFAAQIKVKPEDVLPRPEIKRMDPSTQYAMIAAREAWADAGSPEVDGDRLGAVVSSGIGGIWTTLDGWDTLKERGARRMLPMTVPMLMPNSPAAYVSLEFGARAGAHALVSACASGAEAIGYGIDMIRAGRADVVVAGGTEATIHPMPIAAFAASRTLSLRNDDPQGASRPYDVDRDGFVIGEGAGVVVLESAEHAAARGARVYARIGGVGLSADAYHITSPDPEGRGQVAAMTRALAEAQVEARDVVHVNAHATSTKVGDLTETRSIRTVLGDDADHVLLSATKSMTGHLLGGAGALETIFTVKAVHERLAPPTINVAQPDPELQVPLVRDVPAELPAGDIAAINNSFGFGGHNVALVVTNA
ncbi:beta-ketoacyl-[acyl-carrier-protein] synthase II [Oerskovia turbata]|jgi:3-oxoacyl-[acyl-carrier-protein] synthase II|uniref:3-oxoacyl-[acyl-carrier-protein] synthase 2 n=2 Tax=Oerskovia TaxID=162491 RepID=A0A4Q1L1Q0_9CELL|nr:MULTISPECIES: beta-ketoacyl-ACP synthase II [Oerskovia]MDF2848292.1 beta-ketoacyl-[acyl-carrier-protein] synthase family protein [Oerskovia sp.]TGJ97318.1 beta-ketoacyl-[acyl-carrier-protein] synthase II [Actinotalea fermentans ATCC 43279 = JCM 9966 = DSM 3133]MBD7949938.1 beta-ketoacyl-ACP synthase II [Oerskovia rustica]RXR26114.1 beta-ketoacyl-[acyl-carrier-protein] synthase II [Oerskovia turbata]RXR36616.1 beta-ketoacyl-[acyl-carrier-protein] synthase II [Oerskovia turbata]